MKPADAASAISFAYSRILGGLTEAQLAPLLKDGEFRAFKAGEATPLRSNRRSWVFFILSGVFRVSKIAPDGRLVAMRFARSGDNLGDIEALGDDVSADHYIHCDKAGVCFVLPATMFRDLLAANPNVAAATMRSLATEAQRQGNRIYELTTLDVRLRLLTEIARLARNGVAYGARVRIDPAPTHDSLATQIGASREGVTRYLKEFVQRGWIEVPKRRRLEVTDLSTLQLILARHTVSEAPKPALQMWSNVARRVKSVVLALVTLACLGLSSRAHAASAADSCETAYSSADGAITTSQEYTLAPGDRVHVTVYNEPDLTRDLLVNADGKISFPLIGDIAATGITLADLSKAIGVGLQTYLRDARVASEIAEYRPFYIYGEVNTPGTYPYSASLTVIGAVARAGGFTYRASKSKAYIRRAGQSKELLCPLTGQALVRAGDTIRIGERIF